LASNIFSICFYLSPFISTYINLISAYIHLYSSISILSPHYLHLSQAYLHFISIISPPISVISLYLISIFPQIGAKYLPGDLSNKPPSISPKTSSKSVRIKNSILPLLWSDSKTEFQRKNAERKKLTKKQEKQRPGLCKN